MTLMYNILYVVDVCHQMIALYSRRKQHDGNDILEPLTPVNPQSVDFHELQSSPINGPCSPHRSNSLELVSACSASIPFLFDTVLQYCPFCAHVQLILIFLFEVFSVTYFYGSF